jgi:hypothetical protein
MTTFTLIAKNNSLYFPQGGDDYETSPTRRDCTDMPSMLICRYDAGDIDTCRWPMVGDDHYTLEDLRHNLASALYDERETNGCWPNNPEVIILLPNGERFDFDDVLADRVLRDADVTWTLGA